MQRLVLGCVVFTTLWSGCFGSQFILHDSPHRGRVVDAETGEPIPYAIVAITYEEHYPIDPVLVPVANFTEVTVSLPFVLLFLALFPTGHGGDWDLMEERGPAIQALRTAVTDEDGKYAFPRWKSFDPDPTAILSGRRQRDLYFWRPGYMCADGEAYREAVRGPGHVRTAKFVKEGDGSLRVALHRATKHQDTIGDDCGMQRLVDSVEPDVFTDYINRRNDYKSHFRGSIRDEARDRRFKSSSISKAVEECRSERQRFRGRRGIGNHFAVRTVYTGKERPTDSTVEKLVEKWRRGSSIRPRYHREVLFKEGNEVFWIAVTSGQAIQLQNHVKPGETVDLYLESVGFPRATPIFVLTEFECVECRYGFWQDEAYRRSYERYFERKARPTPARGVPIHSDSGTLDSRPPSAFMSR